MIITPTTELQMLDKSELIARVHRAELQARNAELLLKLERERVQASDFDATLRCIEKIENEAVSLN